MASNLRVDSIVPATGSSVSIGTATGGVSIPGVLTYEDVTNVDSVGVITARSGIRIGATGANTLISGTATGIGIGEDSPDSLLHIGKGTNADDGAVALTIGGSSVNTRQSTITKNNVGSNDRALEIRAATGGSDETIKFFSDATTERLRIGSSGQIGLSGANYGTAGQVLTSQGSGSAVQWANAGGITHARGYRLNNTPDASGGTIDLTNWAYEDSAFNGHLGSGWSLPSSGVFTFPTTGIYDVSMMGMMRQLNNSNAWCGVQGKATTNNSSYNIAFECYQQIVQASGSSNQYVNFYGHCILDVTNTSNVKFKVSFFADQNEQVYLHGGGSYNQTALKFTRLGDT